jgi:hypothetical protein
MGFVHQIYGLKSERELALCISNEWVSAHSVGMQIDSAKQVSTKKRGDVRCSNSSVFWSKQSISRWIGASTFGCFTVGSH